MARFHKDGTGTVRHLAGWKRSPPVPGTHRRQFSRLVTPVPLPDRTRVDYFTQAPVRDQGQWGRCVGEMWRALFCSLGIRAGKGVINYSSWFAYNMGRDYEGTPLTEDSGLVISDSAESVEKNGMCLDEFMPSDEDHFSEEPSPEAKANGAEHQLIMAYHCPTLDEIRRSLADGWVVGIGMSVFENMMSPEAARTGVVKMPEPGERLLGGHAVVLWDCDMKEVIEGRVGQLTCRTPWGEDWGQKSDFKLPVDYVNEGLADEALTPRLIEQ